MQDLSEKVILVCGGATGIGAAAVRLLAEEGARVALGDINIAGAEALASQLREQGARVVAWEYDQSDEASIETLVASVIEEFGQLNGVFANVADMRILQRDADILTNEAAIWSATLQTNVTGTALLIRAALPHVLEQQGAFVLTSSDAGVMGEAERPAYAASKAAINALCRHVTCKWGSEGLRCNVVSPGMVMTEQLDAALPQALKDRILRNANTTRHGCAEDVAHAVVYLLSEKAQWINGQVWRVNGGVSFAN